MFNTFLKTDLSVFGELFDIVTLNEVIFKKV